MKISIIILLLLLTGKLPAQDIITLVEAEKRFARHALDINTRDAFLAYMDSNAIVFEKGEPKNAMELWKAKPADRGKLSWEPAFAVLSATKDFGVTAGPWKYSTGDTLVANGFFTTVWQKDSSGEWKWVLDMGGNYPVGLQKEIVNVETIELTHLTRFPLDAGAMMLQAEKNFIKAYGQNGSQAYTQVADDDAWMNTEGFLPTHKKPGLSTAIEKIPAGIQFTIIGSGISKEGDIGYVYGYAILDGKKENYLRVWRRVSRKWTLLVQSLLL